MPQTAIITATETEIRHRMGGEIIYNLGLDFSPIPTPGGSGKIGISDNTGSYTFYDTLTLALASAVPGDNIVFFTNVTETLSRTLAITINNLSINLNGYTYSYSNTDTNDTITITGGVDFKLSNGIVKRESGTTLNAFQTLPISVKNNSANCTFDNVIFESQDNGEFMAVLLYRTERQA
jgi:hypothetical protein